MDFQKIADGLAHIANTGSTIEKSYLLKKYGSEIEGFKEVLQFIFDPYFSTFIGKKKLDRTEIADHYMSAKDIMLYLHNSTGTDWDAMVANSFIYQEEDPTWQWAATGLVTKDLQIGASVTMLNDVFGNDFIPKIGIMRGMHCPENAKGTYVATEKIDGNRRLIFTRDTGIEIYTRSGRRDTGLIDIAHQAEALPKGYVFDCECVAVGDFVDSIELRQASASILNRTRGQKTGVKALCFDMLPIEEYNKGKSSMAAVFRKYLIATLFGDLQGMEMLKELMSAQQYAALSSFIRNELIFNGPDTPLITGLPILGIVHNKKEALELAQPIWETGGEGIMLVDYKSAYEVNPNPRPTLLKIKQTKEYVLKCVGVYEGKADKRLQGLLGGIYIEYKASNGKVYVVGCGSGFPDYLRVDYWHNPELIVGKRVEIESFGESRNAGGDYSLNCPIFKRIAGAKE